ncbi:MAG: hypothetical protein KC912_21995 [Proteobacteria bacterium]|nr:hypothetical protein [Pseudomonadota bacterium]
MILGVSAVMLLGFTALGVDTGWQRLAMTQLHNAADAGAHAGALMLDGTPDGVTDAEDRAFTIAQANDVHGSAVALTANQDVVIGRYDVIGESDCVNTEGCWTPIGSSPASGDYNPTRSAAVDASSANAVYVQAGEEVNTIFGAFPFGRNTIPAANFAIARLPIVDGQDCTFPMTLPTCMATSWTGTNACNKLMRIRLQSAQADTAAWGFPEGTPAADQDATIMNGMVGEGDCESDITSESIGDGDADIELKNGQMNTAFSLLADQIEGGSGTWTDGSTSLSWDYGTDPIADDSWDTTNWGACPTDLTSCDGTSGGQGATLPNGSWESACPAAAPCDTDGVTPLSGNGFIMRDMSVFTPSAMSCDANGNPQSGSSWNFNTAEDVEGFVRVIVYNVEDQGGDKYMDAFVSCIDPDDGSEVTTPVHDGYDTLIEPPEDGGLSIVE